MKRCPACDRRAYYIDAHCRGCGTAIVPPPPAWITPATWVAIGLYIAMMLFNGWHWLTRSSEGHAVAAVARRTALYVIANGADIAGVFFAAVVAPLVSFYFFLRIMTDFGDWIDLEVQKWRAERFRKHGW